MDLLEYQRTVGTIISQINRVKQDAEYLNDSVNVKKLEDLLIYISENDFNLIVVGEFSRGKSMFVNAIIGRKLLPSSSNPTTATLNFIYDGNEKVEYKLCYYDDSEKEITQEEFENLVANKCNSNSKADQNEYIKSVAELQKIKQVNIKVNNEFGKNGVTIIDTPGVNDLDTRREQITYDYIPKSDAAIILMHAKQQISASEIKFIKEKILKNDISKIFIAINFKDLVHTEDERIRVIKLFNDTFSSIVPKEHIFLVSAKQALKYKRIRNGEKLAKTEDIPNTLEETGIVELEKELCNYLATERGSIKLDRFNNSLMSIIKDIIQNSIVTKQQSITMSKDELEIKIKQLKPQINRKRMQCSNELENLKRSILIEENQLENEYRKLLTSVAYKAKKAVESYTGIIPNELFDIISDETAPLEEELQVHFVKRIQDKISEIVGDSLKRIGEEFVAIGVNMENFGNFSKSEKILSMEDVEKLDVTEKRISTTNEEEGALFLGALAGGFAIGALGIGAIPFLYIGGKLLDAYLTNQESEENMEPTVTSASIRKVFMAEINKKYFSSIEMKVKEFRKGYEQQVNVVIDKIQNECNDKLEQTLNLMENELNNKMQESLSLDDEMKKICDIKDRLLKMVMCEVI